MSLPSVILDKLPSDDEDLPPSGDEDWSDEDSPPADTTAQKTPQKIDISQIMKKTGISIKTPTKTEANNPDSALSKLSGLGFTIKKNSTPIKQEKTEADTSDVMQKLGQLGGIKLKLKSDGNNANTFKVINGLKDFKTSDDEDEGSANYEGKGDQGGESGDEPEKDASDAEQDSDEQIDQIKTRNSDSDEESPLANKKLADALKKLKGKVVTPVKVVPKPVAKPPIQDAQPAKLPGRPAIKQTPKRPNLPVTAKQMTVVTPTQGKDISTTSTPERRESRETNVENVVVKQECEAGMEALASTVPLFSGQIKTERSSPTPVEITTPIISSVKTEPDSASASGNAHPIFQNTPSNIAAPLLPVTKTETTEMTIIEINGDSNDEDDDCCVVSATPAPDVKPIVPKTENPSVSYPPPAYPTPQASYTSPSNLLSSRLTAHSTEKQHSFNWNAPDSKPAIDIFEKSADEIFESLLSTKKENHMSISDASEYISLDTLGPQHSCDVCNTRFTNISLLDEHRRISGHSQSLVAPTSSTLIPYNPSSNILSSLLPVKQLAEQVGKLSTIGGTGPGFTHQQNVMINIQAYPGAGGVMTPQSYNPYPAGQNMHPGFQQPTNNMYGAQGMSGQYSGQMPPPSQPYMGQQGYGQQYQPPMSKASYPGPMPSSPYSTASPLQSMQQAVYGQSSGFSNQVGQMGPPGSSPGHLYVPTSSPGGSMKPPNNGSSVRIQNVQTFTPGQIISGPGQQMPGQEMGPGQMTAPGQPIGNQMPAPGPIRMAAGANITGTRPRMTNVRGARPTIRPGIQVHGQIRGAKPGVRMPMKRPAGMAGGPGQKRRPDMLLPGKHDNEDCHVMAMQKQRDGLPLIQSVQGAKDKLNLGNQLSITKKTVNKEANAMANVLASRGISVKQKQKSRSPSPERPLPHIPNLGAGVSIKHTSKSSNFSIPEAKVGGGMLSCKICNKMFMSHNSLSVHMSNAHPQSKIPLFKCDECPASYPKSLQLQHHKRVFHNVSGPNRELGLPVVDFSQEENLKRLSNLGIYSFIPLANREQVGGCFGIPVISVHNMQNGMTSGLQALGADGLLSLGPLKPLPNT